MPDADDFYRYLTAKRSVDDRALHRGVVEALRGELDKRARAAAPLRITEIGGGVGTMLARLCEWRLVERAHYTLVDVDAAGLSHARRWLSDWARGARGEVHDSPNGLSIRLPAARVFEVELVQADVTRPFQLRPLAPADLLIANAFLDLVDVPRVLPSLFALLHPRAPFWFSINFDGETIFEPGHARDAELIAHYHRTMDTRLRDGAPSGDSKTGRHLFGHLRAAGAELLAAGASDWVVHAIGDSYPGDERYFLDYIVNTVHLALRALPELDAQAVAQWAAERHAQIGRGELAYIAHQLDFMGLAP
jgi:hypothetical protein